MIAVGGAGDGHAGSKIGAAARSEIARGDGDLLRREDVPLQDLEHGIRAAQRLEAENAETLGFVLVEDLAQPRAGGEPGEPAQRGRIVAGPGRDLALCLGECGEAQDIFPHTIAIGLRARHARIDKPAQAGGVQHARQSTYMRCEYQMCSTLGLLPSPLWGGVGGGGEGGVWRGALGASVTSNSRNPPPQPSPTRGREQTVSAPRPEYTWPAGVTG